MKVFIGPHSNWFGPYQLADLLKYFGVSEDTCYNIGKRLSGPEDKPSRILKILQWIDNKKKRNVKIRIDKYDTWNMDITLAMIILPMLKQLKDTKHGAPIGMPAFEQISNSAQYCFDFYEEGDDDAWKKGHEQWTEIFDEIIWSFEQLQPDVDWEDQFYLVRPELDMSEYPEDVGQISVPVRWKTTGKCDYEGMRKHGDRIQNGLKLFGEHFQSFWD